MDTILTLSETSLITHASSNVRAFTDTGSRPTGISAICNQRRTGGMSEIKNREPPVGSINGEEPGSIRREPDRAGLFALEINVTILREQRKANEHQGNGMDGNNCVAVTGRD